MCVCVRARVRIMYDEDAHAGDSMLCRTCVCACVRVCQCVSLDARFGEWHREAGGWPRHLTDL